MFFVSVSHIETNICSKRWELDSLSLILSLCALNRKVLKYKWVSANYVFWFKGLVLILESYFLRLVIGGTCSVSGNYGEHVHYLVVVLTQSLLMCWENIQKEDCPLCWDSSAHWNSVFLSKWKSSTCLTLLWTPFPLCMYAACSPL